MKNFIIYIPALLLLFTACSTDANDANGQDFLDLYGGDPYTGNIGVTILPPDAISEYRPGEFASAQFVKGEVNQAKFVVHGVMEEDTGENGDAGFFAKGTFNQMEWESGPGNVSISIDKNGTISGEGSTDSQSFQMEGTLEEGRLELDVRLEVLEETEGGFPAGTEFVFRYNLWREVDGNGDSGGDSDCDRIVWQQRYISGFDGTGSLISVPVCMD